MDVCPICTKAVPEISNNAISLFTLSSQSNEGARTANINPCLTQEIVPLPTRGNSLHEKSQSCGVSSRNAKDIIIHPSTDKSLSILDKSVAKQRNKQDSLSDSDSTLETKSKAARNFYLSTNSPWASNTLTNPDVGEVLFW